MKLRLFLCLLFIIYPLNAIAFCGEIKDLMVSRKAVVECDWGGRPGEVGKLELESEPTAIVESINPIAVDKSGNVYIGDSINRRVEKFDSNGRFQREYKIPDNGMSYIVSLYISTNGDVYALTDNELLVHFLSDGKISSLVDLKKFGILKKDTQGKIFVGKRRGASGYHHKLYVNPFQDIFVLAGDLFRLNRSGEVVRRWGPDVFNFIIEPAGILTIFYYGSKFEQYNREYSLVNKGQLHEKGKITSPLWGLIRSPEYVDTIGCVFGFTESKDNFLGKYCKKENALYRSPLKQDDLITEKWTVTAQGYIYYTESHGKKFKVIKLSK